MAGLHVYLIGTRLKTQIEALIQTIATEEAGDDILARQSQLPQVEFKKQRSGSDEMEAEEGITISPLAPEGAGGTNERDDIGYRFAIVISYGTRTEDFQANSPTEFYSQAIRQRFHHRRIGSIGLQDSWEIRATVQVGPLPDTPRLREGIDGTVLVLTSYIRESRRVPN